MSVCVCVTLVSLVRLWANLLSGETLSKSSVCLVSFQQVFSLFGETLTKSLQSIWWAFSKSSVWWDFELVFSLSGETEQEPSVCLVRLWGSLSLCLVRLWASLQSVWWDFEQVFSLSGETEQVFSLSGETLSKSSVWWDFEQVFSLSGETLSKSSVCLVRLWASLQSVWWDFEQIFSVFGETLSKSLQSIWWAFSKSLQSILPELLCCDKSNWFLNKMAISVVTYHMHPKQ